LALLVAVIVGAGSILRPDVVPLPHALRRIVTFPEHLYQVRVRDLAWIENDEHGLGMPGRPAANLAIRGIRRVSGGVADGGRVDARRLPELFLGSPETAESEHRALQPFRKWRLEAGAVHVMLCGNWHFLGTPRQRMLFRPY